MSILVLYLDYIYFSLQGKKETVSTMTFGRYGDNALEYVIRKGQLRTVLVNMNGTHQILAYVDGVNLTGDDIRAIKRKTDVLLNINKDIGLTVNIGSIECIQIGRLGGITRKSKSR